MQNKYLSQALEGRYARTLNFLNATEKAEQVLKGI
jgi:hypothetical protein